LGGTILKLSKTSLLDEAAATGFRPDTLEKVIRLLDLLTQINQDDFLKDRLVLKGGTALNLFIFDIPRLSVDIDVNYIGAADLETTQKERPRVEELLTAISERAGYTMNRIAREHAGGKWRLGYQTAMGGQANLELDLNYMFRVTFHPIAKTDSKKLGSYQALQIPILDTKELTSGKLSALLTRTASRDLFDASNLLQKHDAENEDLRLMYVLYGAMNPRANWCDVSAENITADLKDLREKLIPVLKIAGAPDTKQHEQYAVNLVADCKKRMAPLFPLRENEREFVSRLRDKGELLPELLSRNDEFIKTAKVHPGLLRRADMSKNKGTT
jgi:predicted nucleotidyltransferase component of viral defense system